MKSPFLLSLTIVAIAATLACGRVAAQSSARPKVVVHAVAAVAGDNITLGEVADITPSPQTCKASARLAATILGRAPLPGETRPLDRGDIMLKLRQAGIDPATVDIEGAQSLTISQLDTSDDLNSSDSDSDAGSNGQNSRPQILVKPGDEVDVVLVDGRVSVRAKAFAVTGGPLGSTISLRRNGSERLLVATIIGADEAQLEE